MTINRYELTDAEGKYLGYIDAPNQGAAEKIFRKKSRMLKLKIEAPPTFTRKEMVGTYDMGYESWDVEQQAGKFD